MAINVTKRSCLYNAPKAINKLLQLWYECRIRICTDIYHLVVLQEILTDDHRPKIHLDCIIYCRNPFFVFIAMKYIYLSDAHLYKTTCNWWKYCVKSKKVAYLIIFSLYNFVDKMKLLGCLWNLFVWRFKN